jgi:hypothetical protein
MIEYRFEIEACLEGGVTERLVDGSGLQLVTVCLLDGAGVRGPWGRAGGERAGAHSSAPELGARAGILLVGAGRAGRAADGGR